MHLLLILTGLGPSTGGTETQISRMSRWLIAHGHQVTLLANSVNELARPLPESFVAIDAGDRILDLSTPHRSSREWQGLGIDTPHVIKAFDLRASWIATLLADHIRPRPKVVFGNYYPYLIPASSNPLRDRSRRFFLLNLRRNFTDKSILCMTPGHVELFRRAYGATRNPIFWPLPVEDLSVGAPERAPVWGHIVSVGRLDPMKEYNLYMIEVVAELRRRGLPVTWTVYGEGTFMPRMVQRIAELGLGDAIRLAGPIDNSAVPAALRTAYVFVGMGTAIIEAALCRVPASSRWRTRRTKRPTGPFIISRSATSENGWTTGPRTRQLPTS